MGKKVLLGMSGGVDSSVAAKLLLDMGYEVTGVTLKLFSDDDIVLCDRATRTCCSLSDVEDARSVAFKLGIDHFVFNFKDEFKEKVMEHFSKSYIEGKTPNPCIECNRHIKFDKMLRRAKELGFDYIATGHYASIKFDKDLKRYLLVRPNDRTKDQTYVLYSLTQEQLAHTIFPLSGLEKSQVRKIAEECGLVNSRKPDSQDICFVPDGDYVEFIEKNERNLPPEGDFVDMSGNVLGRHKGIIHYTIGQRRGLGITFNKPVYVIKKDTASNTVVLGDEKDLFSKTLVAGDVNLISVEKLEKPMRVTAKARYTQKEQPATIEALGEKILVTFDEPQRALTPGQAVVFYDGDVVVGGGTIE